jgi:hypothetical protein
MNWFKNKKWVRIWNSNHTALIIQTKQVQDFIQASIVHHEILLQHCSCHSNTKGVTALPRNRNLDPRFERSRGSVGKVNNRTFPHYGKTKAGWWEWRKSLLSKVASSSVWLHHCTLKNLIVLLLVTRSLRSKTFMGCSGYDKSASSSVTLGNTTCTGAFKHFFSCNTWKMSWTPAKEGGRSNL